MVSVIVPVYKVEKYLDKCVQSIINQTYKDWEMILVDDGSPDNCGSMCDDYAKSDERIKVIHKENGGLSDARNAGVEQAEGDYVCFVDSDDYLESDMLEVMVSTIGDCEACICGVYNDYADRIAPQYVGEPKSFETDNITAFKLMLEGKVVIMSAWAKIIKKDVAKHLSFPKGRLFEDTFYINDMMRHIKKVRINTKSLYHYVHRDGSITTMQFKPADMDLIYAYREVGQTWNDNAELKKYIRFRLLSGHFKILDKMLLSDNYKSIPEYKQVVGFLKDNAFEVAFTKLFRKSRRIAALVLKINVELYRKLMFAHNKKMAKINL